MDNISLKKIKPSTSLLLKGKGPFTFKYMTRFLCINSECEEICCKDWKVCLNKTNYHMLKKCMSTTKAERDKFQASLELDENSGNTQEYAVLKLQSDGNCSFLNKAGLCIINLNYSKSNLCDTCASYPRIVNKVGDRVELTSTMSCPETVRLCLLAEDATELVEFDPGILPRETFETTIKLPSTDPYLNNIEVVRNTVFELLSLQQYHINIRLFFCACFASRISSFYYKHTVHFSKEILAMEISQIERPELLDDICKEYNEMKISGSFIMSIIHSCFIVHTNSLNTKFRKLTLDCIMTYKTIEDINFEGAIGPLIFSEKLWEDYKKRRLYWETDYEKRIDVYFTNYCRNYLIKNIFVYSPNLLTYLEMMLVHFAILKFLFISHPDLVDLQKTLNSTHVERSVVIDILDKVVVRVTCLFVKHIEHNKAFLEYVLEILNKPNGKG